MHSLEVLLQEPIDFKPVPTFVLFVSYIKKERTCLPRNIKRNKNISEKQIKKQKPLINFKI